MLSKSVERRPRNHKQFICQIIDNSRLMVFLLSPFFFLLINEKIYLFSYTFLNTLDWKCVLKRLQFIFENKNKKKKEIFLTTLSFDIISIFITR